MNLPNTMRSAVTQAVDNPFMHCADVRKKSIPRPKPDELLVRIKACGCCYTDIHAVAGAWSEQPNFPLVLGHEAVGIVEQIGESVHQFNFGDRVGISWIFSTCGVCEYCVSGWESVCPRQEKKGYTVPGCMSEYAIAKADHTVLIPNELSDEEAAPILCAGVSAYKGLLEANLTAGQFVAIIGAGGGVGHLACQYARAMGYRVIAIDVNAMKKRFCESLGAELGIDLADLRCDSKSAAEQVQEYTHGGAHAVLCCAPVAKAYKGATTMCRPGGTIVSLGMPPGNMEVPLVDLALKALTIRGSIIGTRQDLREALDFAARGLVKCTVTLARLEDINLVYDRMTRKEYEGRVVVRM